MNNQIFRRRAETTNQTIKFFEGLLRSTNDGIVVTDTTNNIIVVNDAFCSLFECKWRDVIETNLFVWLEQLDGNGPEQWTRLANTVYREGFCHNEHFRKTAGSCVKYFSVNASLVQHMDSMERGIIISIWSDITTIKNAEMEQKKLKEQLYHSQKMESIGKLAGGIAHDFNNILMAIIGYADLLRMEAEKKGLSINSVQSIIQSSEKAAHLTKSLLAFSRKQLLHLKPENINDIIAGMSVITDGVINKNIEYTRKLTDKNISVMADSAQIEQIIINLVTNATDAMPAGGVLTISTDVTEIDDTFISKNGYGKHGKYALISVSDTGTGMDADIRERIFEPFFTTKEFGKGTGLGLSIVYGIVKQHEGFINVNSEPGRGTTVNIFLPLMASAEQKKTAQKETLVAPEKGAETILVAEDNNDTRNIIQEAFRIHGYNMITASDGEDAINKFKENMNDIDLLILDVKMPKKNGNEVFQEIKKMKNTIPVVFLTGFEDNVISKNIIQQEGVSFLQKPVLPTKLLTYVRNILNKNSP
ncbi:MAG: response regulator [Planctomycetes bacterium]|nr:response regulator [Planctomycetota bacterium]